MNICGVRTRPSARSPWITAEGRYKPGRKSGGSELRLDANEGKPFRSSVTELKKAMMDLRLESAPNRYAVADVLEKNIADRWNVDPSRVVVTAGGDDAISRIIASRTAPASKVLVFEPAFSMFSQYAKARGSLCVELPWWESDAFPLARAVDLIENCPALSLVCLASPSNPLGLCVSEAEALAIAETCAANGAALLFDAAYGEFADEDPSPVLAASRAAPSFIVRSFSKAYGLAGLRIGYAIAPNALEASCLRAAGAPYPVSGLAIAAAGAALVDPDGLAAAIKTVRKEKKILARELESRGLCASGTAESQANFVFFKTKDPRALADAFAGFGIIIRIFPGMRGLEQAVRITCPGDGSDFSKLLEAVRGIGAGSDK